MGHGSRIVRFTAVGISFLLLILGTTGCTKSTGGPSGTKRIVLTGSSTVAPLASEIGKRFEALHPGTRVDVQTGGSSRGILDAREGTADIGMVSRALKDSENDLHPFTIARDGVAMILNAANPVRELDERQIVAIFTGRSSRWSEVGGRDAPITVVNKAEGRATLEVFLAHFRLESRAIEADVIIGDNEQGIKTVAGDPNAIGYVSIGTAELDAAHGVPIRLLPLSGVAATTAELAAGRYPMSRPLNLVTPGAPEGLAREFIEFARSPEAHDAIVQQYFAPVEP